MDFHAFTDGINIDGEYFENLEELFRFMDDVRHRGVARTLETLMESPPTRPTIPTRALMASAAGEVALGIDRPAEVVHDLVDGALGEAPLPAAVLRPAIESLGAALSLTGRPQAAVDLLDERLRQAADDHDTIAHVSLLPLRAHAHLLLGNLVSAVADARVALDLIASHPSASGLAEAPTRYVIALAALELDDASSAERAVSIVDHRARWGGTPMHGWYLDAAARVHAHAHRHHDAIRVWTEAGREFTLVGGSGIVCEWRDGLARSLSVVGDQDEAESVASEQMSLAVRFGDARMSAIARGTCAAVEPDHRIAADLLSSALRDLPTGRGGLVRCRLGSERGARLRRAGRRRSARDQLATALAEAARFGAVRLARVIEAEIAAAGGGTPPRSGDGRLALTAAERETAVLAARGLTNAEIAQRRSVSRKTVEAQLSSLYRKLGVRNRERLAEVLPA